MKIILSTLFAVLVYFNIGTEVYICKGLTSKVYHKSDKCKGLSNCSNIASKVSKEEAIQLGKRECKIEYN